MSAKYHGTSRCFSQITDYSLFLLNCSENLFWQFSAESVNLENYSWKMTGKIQCSINAGIYFMEIKKMNLSKYKLS
jgi:hypothetical protein